MSYRFFCFMLLIFISTNGMGQSAHKLLLEGDQLYKKEQFNQAEEKYRKAKAKDKTGKASYNLGTSLTELERYEEAANQFSNAAELSEDPTIKSKALYNLGNTHFRNEKYKESVDAYKRALSFDQTDQQTKENLMMAKQMLRVQEQQQQQQQQQENQENEEEQDQEQQEEQQDQPQDQSQDENQEDKEQPQDAKEAEKKDLDKEDARKLLEIIENEEQKVQEKLRKMKGNSKKPKKDW